MARRKVTQVGHGVTIRYLPVNQAYAVMWHDQVLRLFNRYDDAERYADEIAGNRSMQANPSSFIPFAFGALLVGGLVWWATRPKEAQAATAPAPLPPAVSCTVDQQRLSLWSATAGVAAFHVPMLALTDPMTPGQASDLLPEVAKLKGTTQVVLVDQDDVFHYFANEHTPSVRRDDLFADYCNKYGGGAVAGHPANMFMM